MPLASFRKKRILNVSPSLMAICPGEIGPVVVAKLPSALSFTLAMWWWGTGPKGLSLPLACGMGTVNGVRLGRSREHGDARRGSCQPKHRCRTEIPAPAVRSARLACSASSVKEKPRPPQPFPSPHRTAPPRPATPTLSLGGSLVPGQLAGTARWYAHSRSASIRSRMLTDRGYVERISFMMISVERGAFRLKDA